MSGPFCRRSGSSSRSLRRCWFFRWRLLHLPRMTSMTTSTQTMWASVRRSCQHLRFTALRSAPGDTTHTTLMPALPTATTALTGSSMASLSALGPGGVGAGVGDTDGDGGTAGAMVGDTAAGLIADTVIVADMATTADTVIAADIRDTDSAADAPDTEAAIAVDTPERHAPSTGADAPSHRPEAALAAASAEAADSMAAATDSTVTVVDFMAEVEAASTVVAAVDSMAAVEAASTVVVAVDSMAAVGEASMVAVADTGNPRLRFSWKNSPSASAGGLFLVRLQPVRSRIGESGTIPLSISTHALEIIPAAL